VLHDDDASKLVVLGMGGTSSGLSDEEVEDMIAGRNAARKRRDFAAADRIRQELADRGIILEDTKDGIRWKRK